MYNYLYNIYIALGIISNLEMVSSIREDMCRLYANTMPHVRYPLDLGVHGSPRTDPLQILRTSVHHQCPKQPLVNNRNLINKNQVK